MITLPKRGKYRVSPIVKDDESMVGYRWPVDGKITLGPDEFVIGTDGRRYSGGLRGFFNSAAAGRYVVRKQATPLFPSVFTREVIVVNFGGTEHELTTEEANKLIRDLELAVA